MSFSNGNNDQSTMLRVGGLWRNQSKDGKTYLAGSVGGLRVFVFENKFKDGENDPDYILSVAQGKQKDAAKKQQTTTPSL